MQLTYLNARYPIETQIEETINRMTKNIEDNIIQVQTNNTMMNSHN
jgi:hypothetical protein